MSRESIAVVSGAGGPGAGGQLFSLAQLEQQRTRALVRDREATWHSQGSHLTVAAILLQWREKYWQIPAAKPADALKIAEAIQAFSAYVEKQANDDLRQHWQQMQQSFLAPLNAFDDIATIDLAGKKHVVRMGIREVFALVYLATTDIAAYPDSEQQERDLLDRLHSLANAVITMNLEAERCHLGVRQDLVGVLNGVYPGVKMIIDIDSFLLGEIKAWLQNFLAKSELDVVDTLRDWVLEQEMPDALIDCLKANNGQALVVMLKALLKTCQAAGIVPDEEFKKKLQGFVGIDGLVSLAPPIGNQPALCALAEYMALKNSELSPVFRKKKQVFDQKLPVEWKNDDASYQQLNSFILAAKADFMLRRYADDLLSWDVERLCADDLAATRSVLTTYLDSEVHAATLSTEQQRLLDRFNMQVMAYRRDKREPLIENFFADYFMPVEDEHEGNRIHLNRLLFAQGFRDHVLVDDELAGRWQRELTSEGGVTEVDVLHVNRLFLTALMLPIDEWGEVFYRFLADVYRFVAAGFDATAQLRGQRVVNSSYPECLLLQLQDMLYDYRAAKGLWQEGERHDSQQWPLFTVACLDTAAQLLETLDDLDLNVDDLQLSATQLQTLFSALDRDGRKNMFLCLIQEGSWQAAQQLMAVYDNPAQAKEALADLLNKALCDAAAEGRCEVVQALLDLTADVNTRDENGDTPLHFAVSACAAGAVTVLLAAGAAVNVLGDHGDSPLMIAVGEQRLDLVQQLTAAGASCMLASGQAGAYSPWHEAVGRGRLEIVDHFLSLNALLLNDATLGKTALMTAAEKGQSDMVKYLLSRPGIDLEKTNVRAEQAITMAVRRGHGAVVRLLLKAGADINACDAKGRSLLMLAAKVGRIAMLHFLYTKGADLNYLDCAGRSFIAYLQPRRTNTRYQQHKLLLFLRDLLKTDFCPCVADQAALLRFTGTRSKVAREAKALWQRAERLRVPAVPVVNAAPPVRAMQTARCSCLPIGRLFARRQTAPTNMQLDEIKSVSQRPSNKR